MKKIRLYIEEILVHICVALSIACISFKFLDWYNPYMNFLGLKVSTGLMIAFCLLTLVQSAWVLHTLWQKSQGRKPCPSTKHLPAHPKGQGRRLGR